MAQGFNSDVPAQNEVVAPGADPYPKYKIEKFNLFGGINAKVSSYIDQNTPQQFRDILNLNFFAPGALSSRQGSTLYGGATISGSIQNGIEFQRLNGSSWIITVANTNLYINTPTTVQSAVTGLKNAQYTDFQTFADRLFFCNGDTFQKFDGTNSYKFSLPPGATASWGVTAAVGGSMTNGVTGIFVCGYGYLNERGYAGPVSNGQTIVLNGVTFNSIAYFGMTQAFSGYGISAIQLWRTVPGGINFFGTTLADVTLAGTTQIVDTGFPLGSSLAIPHLWFTLAPRFLELYNNQLFMGGFSQYPSRVYWSEIGEPEAVQAQFYAEFRTNDGDILSGIKPYSGALMVGKQKSLHRIVGDNPSNFSLQEVSTEYGCLSQQSMVVFENLFWCLDQKGMAQFDGGNIGIVSIPVEPYFLNANFNSLIDKAVSVHFKQAGEVWVSLPSAGSSINNILLVYDYIVKAWTRYDGIKPSALFIAQGNQSIKTLFYGGYTGGLFFMGQSYLSDNGVGFTCSFLTNWLASGGQTSEQLYRRLWLDVNPILGITQNIGIQMYSNYVTSTISYSGVMSLTAFQNRIDFGVSARSLALQIAYSSATLPFKLNAYTFESRYQRSV